MECWPCIHWKTLHFLSEYSVWPSKSIVFWTQMTELSIRKFFSCFVIPCSLAPKCSLIGQTQNLSLTSLFNALTNLGVRRQQRRIYHPLLWRAQKNKLKNKINQFRPWYINYEWQTSMLHSLHRFPESFVRDRIQLKDAR